MNPTADLIAQQLIYYRKRAATYPQFIRWYMDCVRAPLTDLIRQTVRGGDGLELAPGTGYWTNLLAEVFDEVTAVDGAVEMLRVLETQALPNVKTLQADLFSWTPPRKWDAVFFANWLAHVPPAAFDAFWDTVRAAVKPGGLVVCIDVTADEQPLEHTIWQQDDVHLVARPADHQIYPVIKQYWDPEELVRLLDERDWTGTFRRVGQHISRGFVFYTFRPR